MMEQYKKKVKENATIFAGIKKVGNIQLIRLSGGDYSD
jgi:hypothetical protein